MKTLNEVFDKLTLSAEKNHTQTTNTNDSKTFIEQIKQMKPEKENNIKSDIDTLFKTVIKEAVKNTDGLSEKDMGKQSNSDSNSSMFKFDIVSSKNDSSQSPPLQSETRQLDVKSMADILKIVDVINSAKDSGIKSSQYNLTLSTSESWKSSLLKLPGKYRQRSLRTTTMPSICF